MQSTDKLKQPFDVQQQFTVMREDSTSHNAVTTWFSHDNSTIL